MTDNIKSLFNQMEQGVREEALLCLNDEFKKQSRKKFTKEWINVGSIPEDYQERIVELFQNLVKKQSTKKLYSSYYFDEKAG